MSPICLLAIALTSQSGDISRYLQNDLHDAAFQAKVTHADQRELAKINSDFGASYRFGTTDIHLKEPFKLRIDARVEDTHLTYVINGTTQVLKVGPINQKTNLAHAPGRRQTDFDFGLLTPSLFGDLYTSRFVRNDRETGDPVFDLYYIPSLGDKTRNRIWIDPAHHVIAKREWYAQDGHLLATFVYTDPTEQNGVWLPTQLEVRNVDNVVAGVTRYSAIKVNEGVSDSLFNVR